MSTSVPFPATSTPGMRPGEGQGRLVNCRAVKEGDLTIWRRCAGLRALATLPTAPIRGMLASGVFVYVVAGSACYRVAQSGAIEALTGVVAGTGPVMIAQNNAPVPQIVIVSSLTTQAVDGSIIRQFPDGDLPNALNSVARVGGYLVFTTPGGEILATDLNTLDVNPLAFARAESDPDGLKRGVVSGGIFYAMGGSTIEGWQDTGDSPFPLSRLSTVVPVGLLSAGAVAGGQGEWDHPPIFVAADATVRVLAGLQTQIVSTPDLQRRIERADPSTLRACVYAADGRAYWVLSSSEWTWEFDVLAGSWSERESAGLGVWRVAATARQWGQWIGADASTGALYVIDSAARDEAGAPLIFGADSAPVKQFPTRAAITSAMLEFTLGHGVWNRRDPVETEPRVMIGWSRDGGAHWDGPAHRSLGVQGDYVGACRVNRLGLASHHGVRLRWRVSDPVDVAFTGAMIEGEARAP